MGSNVWPRTTPDGVDTVGFDRGGAVTRTLLGYGVLAGPFYLIVALLQAFLRDGFDLKRHALSHLANGPGGWVQTANFVLTGLMVVAAAVGFARVLRPRFRALSTFLGTFGVSMLVAAAFPADPVLGFPPGTPEGYPTSISTPGLVHFIAGAIGFLSLSVSCLLAAVAMSRRKEPALSRVSLVCGIAVVAGFFGGAAFSSSSAGIAGIWFSVIVGWAWLVLMSLHLYRAAHNVNRAPPPV